MISSIRSDSINSSPISTAQRHREVFNKLDVNGDGKISESELQALIPKDGKGPDVKTLLKQIDTEGDGTINLNELNSFLTKIESQKKPSGGQHAGGGPKGGGKVSGGSSNAKIYDVMDTNKDGTVSIMEKLMYEINHPTASATTSAQTAQSYNKDGRSIATMSGKSLNVLV